ncbi:MAG: type II toxin-antitoxin system HicA family toxin [Anaerolineae bacterium]|nr:type II toxin-antitoxin system HicA family toxin [Anaerolineae bacterium]MCK6578302.1 type II toxin-antitoxin system HicA family toxin [Anaerolineae bacterium]NUQ06786.1 type II toxin-antitoxin system HicA family toxin [Anaerolineae bacterium]
MSKLPRISGKDCLRALSRAGFVVRRQTGSHIILKHPSPARSVIVPNHDELALGTLRRIIRDAGLTVEEFLTLLNQ